MQYPVPNLFQQCLACVCVCMCKIVSACVGYAQCMGVGEEYKDYMGILLQVAQAVNQGMPKETTCRECWRLRGVKAAQFVSSVCGVCVCVCAMCLVRCL